MLVFKSSELQHLMTNGYKMELIITVGWALRYFKLPVTQLVIQQLSKIGNKENIKVLRY